MLNVFVNPHGIRANAVNGKCIQVLLCEYDGGGQVRVDLSPARAARLKELLEECCRRCDELNRQAAAESDAPYKALLEEATKHD